MLVTVPTVAVCMGILNADAGNYGADFHHGIWSAGADVLHGRSPFPPANPRFLLHHVNSFVTPPPLALVGVAFSTVPFPIAIVLWNLICFAALAAALRLMDVRDLRIYVLALASLPLVDSLTNGQPDALFALGAAVSWRYRDSPTGALAAGALIATKLLAWPLLIWYLATRRFRSFGFAAVSALTLLFGSWAIIGFHGFAQYPRLLAADAKAFETWPFSYGAVQALSPLGLSVSVTRILAVAIAGTIAIGILGIANRSDEGWFSAALTFGVLASPFLWPHYLVVLLIPLALMCKNRLGIWVVTAYGFWLSVIFLHTSVSRAIAILSLLTALLFWAMATGCARGSDRPVSRPVPTPPREPPTQSLQSEASWSAP